MFSELAGTRADFALTHTFTCSPGFRVFLFLRPTAQQPASHQAASGLELDCLSILSHLPGDAMDPAHLTLSLGEGSQK